MIPLYSSKIRRMPSAAALYRSMAAVMGSEDTRAANSGFSFKRSAVSFFRSSRIRLTGSRSGMSTDTSATSTRAARRAFLFAPTEESSAVTQVPIFCPMIIYTAALNGTSPAAARLCKMPTDADELWMIAVTSAPARIPRNGLCPSFTKMLQNASDS